MNKLRSFWASTLGKKVVMAVTGIIMIVFLVLHMAGNLQAFQGAEKFNGYAAILHGPLHEVVLLQRVVLLLSVVLHIIAATQLTLLDRAARPVGYAKQQSQASTVASRTLRVGGVVLLGFIVLHLLHFTTGQLHPSFIESDAYHNLTSGFANPLVAIGYLVAMAAVGLHLYHGAWSSLRSLGAASPRPNPRARPIAGVIALVVWLGFSIIPLAVLAGWIQ